MVPNTSEDRNQNYLESLALNPCDAQALKLLIRATEARPDQAAALKKLAEQAADHQAPVFYAMALAQIFEQQREGDKAITLYNRLLERRPTRNGRKLRSCFWVCRQKVNSLTLAGITPRKARR